MFLDYLCECEKGIPHVIVLQISLMIATLEVHFSTEIIGYEDVVELGGNQSSCVTNCE